MTLKEQYRDLVRRQIRLIQEIAKRDQLMAASAARTLGYGHLPLGGLLESTHDSEEAGQ